MSELQEIKPRRVVVADDTPQSLSLLSEGLKAAGYDVIEATNGKDAIQCVKDHQPDLVVLDYNMPEMTGLEALKVLRAEENYVAVIFVSANSDEKCITECLEAGADDYIRKPFSLSELGSRVSVRFRIKDLHDELRIANNKLADLSEHDDLTGLFNMRSMYSRIDNELKRGRRYNRLVAAMMMDMDQFKTINDGADHLFGSFVLKEVGGLVKQNMREVDLAARYGGDEYLIVLTETTIDGPRVFGERLREVIQNYEFNDGRHRARRTASLGYAVTTPGAEITAVELVRKADHALYEAKRAGKNRVVGYQIREKGAAVPAFSVTR